MLSKVAVLFHIPISNVRMFQLLCNSSNKMVKQLVTSPFHFKYTRGDVVISHCGFNLYSPLMRLLIIYFGRPWKPQTTSEIIERRGPKNGIGWRFLWTPGLNPEMHTWVRLKSTPKALKCSTDHCPYPRLVWVVHTQDRPEQAAQRLWNLSWCENCSPQKVSQNWQNLTGPFTARTH